MKQLRFRSQDADLLLGGLDALGGGAQVIPPIAALHLQAVLRGGGECPAQFSQMLAAALAAFLLPIDETGQDRFQSLGLEHAFFEMGGDEMVELSIGIKRPLAGLALPRLGRASVWC